MALCRGTKQQKEMAQAALNRFWWPALMMFGQMMNTLQTLNYQ